MRASADAVLVFVQGSCKDQAVSSLNHSGPCPLQFLRNVPHDLKQIINSSSLSQLTGVREEEVQKLRAEKALLASQLTAEKAVGRPRNRMQEQCTSGCVPFNKLHILFETCTLPMGPADQTQSQKLPLPKYSRHRPIW